MRLRRCAILQLEPQERIVFDLATLSAGGDGLRDELVWLAYAPQLPAPAPLKPDELHVLGAISPSRWRNRDELAAVHAPAVLEALHAMGLLIEEHSAAAAQDERLRRAHWRSASAVMHYASRWHGVDADAAQRQIEESENGDLLSRLGPPEPVVSEHVHPSARVALQRPGDSPLEQLLLRRVTCRNFDRNRSLSAAQFSSVLFRAWGARTVHDFAPNVPLLKRGVPSAGGLHATEAYLLVQRVEGIAPGLYHYHPIDHALEPLRALDGSEANALARSFVAGQEYFVDAHVMVIAASRFHRMFWKYRNHAKAYRALLLDIGHLSQAQYLAATEIGLAAFITAAINEVDIEQAFGLDPLEEGPLAVTGFGIRAAECREVEWDPLNVVWPKS